jgi:hypothetical protein
MTEECREQGFRLPKLETDREREGERGRESESKFIRNDVPQHGVKGLAVHSWRKNMRRAYRHERGWASVASQWVSFGQRGLAKSDRRSIIAVVFVVVLIAGFYN